MKVLVISAHADDAELGVGGTIAKHVDASDDVTILLVTHSGYETYEGTVVRSRDTAMREAHLAGEILGVSDIMCLDYDTKYVKYGVQLIEDLNRAIDKIKPDIIYTHWDGDVNQDHSAIARATVVAARNVPRILMYTSNWYKSTFTFDGRFYIDISDFIDQKTRAIGAHKSEVEKRGISWVEFFKNQCNQRGVEVGVEYAELFKIIKWLS